MLVFNDKSFKDEMVFYIWKYFIRIIFHSLGMQDVWPREDGWLWWGQRSPTSQLWQKYGPVWGSIPCLLIPGSCSHQNCNRHGIGCVVQIIKLFLSQFHLFGSSYIQDMIQNVNTSFMISKTIQHVKSEHFTKNLCLPSKTSMNISQLVIIGSSCFCRSK